MAIEARSRYHARVPEAGSVIGGKYRLRKRVGEGAMASVWSAVHETLGRPVAVKFIHAKVMASEVSTARFMREARIAAAIQHRFVVDIFDFGKTEQGEPYMVMELLNGESLADRITRGPALPVKTFVRMMEQCLTGLDAVHSAGIIHRDLKPENVFVIHDGDGGFPKLLDFGVSRVDDSMMGEKTSRLTREGAVLGTPWYMSPEQVRGKSDIDHRADLYSIGVMLYEVLTGVLPFDAETIGDLLVMIATEEPAPLSTLRPDLPQALSDIVAQAMAKDADDRYQSAKTMRIALRSLREKLPANAFTVVMQRAPSDPPEALESGDLMPRMISQTSKASSPAEVARRNAATLSARPTPKPVPQPARALALDDDEPLPASKSRIPWLVAVAALMVAAIAVAVAMNAPEDPVADEVETDEVRVAEPPRGEPRMVETPVALPETDTREPRSTGEPAPETMEAARVEETVRATPMRRITMEPTMEATTMVTTMRQTGMAGNGSPEHFDDPGF